MTEDSDRPDFEGTATTTGVDIDRRKALGAVGGAIVGSVGLATGLAEAWKHTIETVPAGSIEAAATKIEGDDWIDLELETVGTTTDGEPQYRVNAATDDLDDRTLYADGEPASRNVILDEIEGDSGLLGRGNYVIPLAREVHEYFGEFAAPFEDDGPEVAEYRFELHGQGGYIEDTIGPEDIERYDDSRGGQKNLDAIVWTFDAVSYYDDHFTEHAEIRPYEEDA